MTSISNFNYNLPEIFIQNYEGLIYVLNSGFECEYVNESVHFKLLGYSIGSQKIDEVIFYADIKRCIRFLNEVLKNGKASEELRIKQFNDYAYLEFHGIRFIDNNNNAKILLTGYDISKYKGLEYEWSERERNLRKLAESMPEIRFWKLLQTKSEKSSFQKSREMLDLVIDNIPHFVYWKNRDLQYMGCNKNYALINNLGNPNFIVGKIDSELPWSRINSSKLKEVEKNVMDKNQSEERIEIWKNLQDNDNYYEVNRIPLQNLNQEVVGILCTYNNITNRIKAEQDLKESEQKYRSILENIKEGYFEVDLKGTITFCNESLCELWKYPKEELIGKGYRDITDEINQKKIFRQFNEVYKSKKVIRFLQFEFVDKQRNKIIAETSVNLRNDQQGEIIGFSGIVHDITEKYYLEQKLKFSEEKYRHLFDTSPFVVWLLDLNGRIIDCNETTNKLLAIYKKEDLINKHFIEILSIFERPEYYIPFFKEKFESFIRGEPLKAIDFSITRGDGKKLWLALQSSKIQVESETLIYVIIQDITEKKEGELKLQKSEEELKILNKQLEQMVFDRTKELRESEEKFRSIAEQTSLGIAILQDGYLVYTNKALAEITGYNNEEIDKWSQNKFISKIHPDDLAFILKQLRKKMDGHRELTHYSCRIKTNTEQFKWIDLHSKAITYKGKFADLITFIDISEKKEAEQKLVESEEKFRHLYQNSPNGIAILDMKGKIMDVNTTITQLFGYKKEELIGNNYLSLIRVYPKEVKPAIRTIEQLLAKNVKDKEFFKPNIIRIKKKDGTKAWIESEISVIRVGQDQLIQAIIQDITEKRIAEEKIRDSEQLLRKQNIELKELDRLKTDFISIAAHELKTPLISIGGYLDLILLREKELKEEIKEDIVRALNNVHRLELYINRLLDVMKIDAKKMQLLKQDEEILKIIEKSLLELEFQINQKNIKISFSIPENFILRVDGFRIGQVFSNILSNAVKFTPENGKIEIVLNENENFYVFKIIDNGQGLTEEEKQKLFGKFVTLGQGTDNFSTFDKGSGLGLYIAKGIIEAHGGTIGVESEGVGKGAEFYFTLPKS